LPMVGTSSTCWPKRSSSTTSSRLPATQGTSGAAKAVAELYRPYGTMIVLDRCHDLAVHHDIKTGVVVLEYASEGRVVSTGAPYTNRYISVLTITDRKVTHWRDYLDPVAVFDALGWPSR
jgi:uncharacterized protein